MRPDTTILAFDTSAAHCAAALHWGGQVHTRIEEMARGQGERLMPLLEELLAEHGLAWSDLDGIGVGVGPGNFTGIRISVSAARGLALGLGIPAVGVSAFDAAAFGLKNVIACIPAPRNQAYVQSCLFGADKIPVMVDLEKIENFPNAHPKAEVALCGPAATDVAAAMGDAFDTRAQTTPPIEAIARIAAARLYSVKDRPTPLYIKPPDAAPPREAAPVILP